MQLKIKVIPRSKESSFLGKMDDGSFKIRLKALPENGEANKELITFLAKELSLRKDDVQLLSGHKTTRKCISIPDLTPLPW